MKKKMFDEFEAREWIEYYDCLNSETPVNELRLKLSDEEKEAYIKDLEKLKEARKTFPAATFEVKYSWFE